MITWQIYSKYRVTVKYTWVVIQGSNWHLMIILMYNEHWQADVKVFYLILCNNHVNRFDTSAV